MDYSICLAICFHSSLPNYFTWTNNTIVETYFEAMQAAKRAYLERLLTYCNNKVYLASIVSGLNRTYLHKLIRQINPQRPDHRYKQR